VFTARYKLNDIVKPSGSFLMSVCPTVHVNLGYRWTDLCETVNFGSLLKSSSKIQVPLRQDTNNKHVTRSP
jgi:hypothetical protein